MVNLSPNYCIIVGAQKAGTTSLFNWLTQHPEIFGPPMAKDYHFYSIDEEYNKGEKELAKRFEGEKKEKILLHAAVNYMYNEIALQRISKDLPDAKIIAVLRNPVDRAISAHKYFKKIGTENYSFKNAIDREINGKLQPSEMDDFGYLSHGLYASQIQNLYKYFPKENLKILFYDDLMKNKESKIHEIFQFLNLNIITPSFTHLNQGGAAKYTWLNRFLNQENFIKKNFKNVIPLDLRIKLKYFITEKNVTNQNELKEEEIDYQFLKEYYREDITMLSQIMQVDFKKNWL